MSRQAQDLINDAGKTLGILQSGEAFSPDELNDALVVLNFMVENWNTQGLQLFNITNFTQALSAAQTTPYTIGTGGTLDTNRPVKIESANIIQSNGVSTPLELIDSKRYASILHKAATDVVPLLLYNDNEFPLANLYLHPWSSGTPTLDLWMWQQLNDNFGLTDTLAFPPGYYQALRYNLAVDLLAMFPRPEDSGTQVVIKRAQELKDELRGLQASNRIAAEDPPPPAVPPGGAR
jgi:hypothetical protein